MALVALARRARCGCADVGGLSSVEKEEAKEDVGGNAELEGVGDAGEELGCVSHLDTSCCTLAERGALSDKLEGLG